VSAPVHASRNARRRRLWCGAPWRHETRVINLWQSTTCEECLQAGVAADELPPERALELLANLYEARERPL
jgi:hypothetical protein